jgi:hypothetical protein
VIDGGHLQTESYQNILNNTVFLGVMQGTTAKTSFSNSSGATVS